MKGFFISYNKADRDWAEWIAWTLEEDGHTTIIQAWDFRGGSNFVVEMDRAAKEGERTLAVLSQAYLDALYTHPEWAAAFAKDPKGEHGTLLPVCVRDCDPEALRGLLGQIIHIDLRGLDEAAAKKALLQGIDRGRAKPAAKPAFPPDAVRSVATRPTFPGAVPPIWNVPHPRNPNFTGRADLLTSLRGSLTTGRHTALTHAVHGLGGVGKTQLALEYAYRHAGDYPVIYWVRSEEPAQLAADYAALAGPLDLPGKDAQDQTVTVAAVRRWLEHNDGWLLIFDNAPHPDAVRDYLPHGGSGHLIITSRDPNWGAVAAPLNVPTWPRNESVAFIEKRTDQGGDEADALAHELGDLPLALEQAVAYIAETRITLAEYLDLFRTRREELWKHEKPPADYDKTTGTTWSLNMTQVAAESPAAADLLNLCAFLAPDDIPLSLFRDHADELPEPLKSTVADPLALNNALATLRRYSLIQKEGDATSLHRLVQAVARDRLPDGQKKEWAGAAAAVVNAAYPQESDDVRFWPACAALLPHALSAAGHAEELGAALKEAGRLLNQAGLYLNGRAAFSEARALFERALEIDLASFGPEHPNVAIRLNNLAGVAWEQGDLAGARRRFEQALEILEKLLGKDDPNVATLVNNLAAVLRAQGDLVSARQHSERALETDLASLGPEHPDIATDLSSLARVLQQQGDLVGARERFERALEISLAAYGPDHPRVAGHLSNLATVLQDQGYLARARERFERALKIDLAAYGPEHPDVAKELNNIAGVLRYQGDLAGARERFERALAISEKALGEHHPDVAAVVNNLGGGASGSGGPGGGAAAVRACPGDRPGVLWAGASGCRRRLEQPG